ncbi:MAG: DUF4159 domain-containing protein [Isosphaeraceae bacterium]
MLRSSRRWYWIGVAGLALVVDAALGPATIRGDVTSEQVEHAIRLGVRFLKARQQPDGSWPEVEGRARTGTTSLITLALITAGENPASPAIQRAVEYLRHFGPEDLKSTYAISLQTMVFAAAEPRIDRVRIVANVKWLEHAQLKFADRQQWPGSWTYSEQKSQAGDNSNTQYALLGLNAASEAGVSIDPQVWALSRVYFEKLQNRDGGWSYRAGQGQSTGSMTCAGLSSLIITGGRRFQSQEFLEGHVIHNCGKGGFDPAIARGIDWLTSHFQVSQNFGNGAIWKHYYLYALERAGRLAGVRFFGRFDWYRLGAEELVRTQNQFGGFWIGFAQENDVVATSFALLFLAKGRAPVLINKLRHLPADDWNNDPDDVRNMVGIVSRDWNNLLTWQTVDSSFATVEDMLQAPIVFFNGHRDPQFSEPARKNLRSFVEQGGFILTEACCGSPEFDQGVKRLIKAVFPEDEYQLKLLPPEHPVWRARHLISPAVNPLWGIEYGCRTVLIYSPSDLSCYWNQAEHGMTNPAVIKAVRVGQNIVDYVTGRAMPADKLAVREVRNFKADAPKRGALRIAKLKHTGDWNIAPLAIPNLMDALHRPPLSFDVVITQKDLVPSDPSLIYYPLIYIHGRAVLAFGRDDLDALRRHLDPGGGTLFADAACGSKAFDIAFRRFVAQLLPNKTLVPIPNDDELFTDKVAFDLSDSQYTPAAGGGRNFPQLEGVKINNHWAIIYSKFDIGCALERHTGIDCKGYSHQSAVKIAANIVIYATLP